MELESQHRKKIRNCQSDMEDKRTVRIEEIEKGQQDMKERMS